MGYDWISSNGNKMKVSEANMYSEKEQQMFNFLKIGHLTRMMFPSSLYDCAVKKAFTENLQGNAVESLRRTYSALTKCFPLRLTKEFDDLIEL